MSTAVTPSSKAALEYQNGRSGGYRRADLIVRRDREVDGVRNLRRHAVEGKCRDEANHTLWNLESQRYAIWVLKRFFIVSPVEAAIQPLKELILSNRRASSDVSLASVPSAS